MTRAEREADFSRRALLRAGCALPIALTLGLSACSSSDDDRKHTDASGGSNHADTIAHADGTTPTSATSSAHGDTTTGEGDTPHVDAHLDLSVPGLEKHADEHFDTPHGDR
jgi:hypothetical protein